MENTVVVNDYAQMDKILREERNYILQTIKKIRASGCNVLLIQKSILRDAVTDLALHYLVRRRCRPYRRRYPLGINPPSRVRPAIPLPVHEPLQHACAAARAALHAGLVPRSRLHSQSPSLVHLLDGELRARRPRGAAQAKAKIMVLKDIERDEIEFISKSLGCMPVSHVDHIRAEKLGAADLVQEVSVGGGKMVRVTGVAGPAARTACVLLRGSNKLVLEEAERSLHDALCVIRCLVQQPFMLPGGSAPEMEVAFALTQWSTSLGGMESYAVREYAEALEVVPYTLSENAGLNPIHIVSQLRALHAQGQVGRACPSSSLSE